MVIVYPLIAGSFALPLGRSVAFLHDSKRTSFPIPSLDILDNGDRACFQKIKLSAITSCTAWALPLLDMFWWLEVLCELVR